MLERAHFADQTARFKGTHCQHEEASSQKKKKQPSFLTRSSWVFVVCRSVESKHFCNYSVAQGLGFPSKAPTTKGWIMLQVNVPPLGAKMWKFAGAGKPKALERHFLGVGISVLFLTPRRRDFCCGGDAVPLASRFPGSLQAVTCAVRSRARFLASDTAIVGC